MDRPRIAIIGTSDGQKELYKKAQDYTETAKKLYQNF